MLFTAIVLLSIKNVFTTLFQLFICFINQYTHSFYIRIFIKIFSLIILFAITLFTIGGILGLIFKCSQTYISGGTIAVTGILITIGGSIVI